MTGAVEAGVASEAASANADTLDAKNRPRVNPQLVYDDTLQNIVEMDKSSK
jgi:hypothetical protein